MKKLSKKLKKLKKRGGSQYLQQQFSWICSITGHFLIELLRNNGINWNKRKLRKCVIDISKDLKSYYIYKEWTSVASENNSRTNEYPTVGYA